MLHVFNVVFFSYSILHRERGGEREWVWKSGRETGRIKEGKIGNLILILKRKTKIRYNLSQFKKPSMKYVICYYFLVLF